jgi:translation initiation factor 1 (eIF-1/SUI1)
MDLDLLDEQLNRDDQSVDIRCVQRNGKKYITTVEGIMGDNEYLKSIAKDLRKLLNVSCSLGNNGVLTLSGNNHESIIKYLKDKHKIENVKVNNVT